MPIRPPLHNVDNARKRKVHRKSRQGCANCKLRRVKCDETKPSCRKCIDYSVSCSYNSVSSELELQANGAFGVMSLVHNTPSHHENTISMINSHPNFQEAQGLSSRYPVYPLQAQDLELLYKYQKRTAQSIGTTRTQEICKNEILNMAFSSPYLMHMILTLSLRHDRFLSAVPSTKPSIAEAYHWYHGTALYGEALSRPVKNPERDALWATAAILGTIAFSCLETSTPEEAWPLKPRSSTDLDWLTMSDGKKSIRKLTNPDREDSIFYGVYDSEKHTLEDFSASGSLASLPEDLLRIFQTGSAIDEESPYYKALLALALVINMDCNQDTVLIFLSFIGEIDQRYRKLIEDKEPKALLIMAYWFAKLCQYHGWWIWRRAVLECQAIVIYLERFHSHETSIVELLPFPKVMSGLFERKH